MIDSGVIRLLRGLVGDGRPSMVMVKRAAAASTVTVWTLRCTVGSAQSLTRVRSGPIPASAKAAAIFALAGKPAAAPDALPSKMQVGAVMPARSIFCPTTQGAPE